MRWRRRLSCSLESLPATPLQRRIFAVQTEDQCEDDEEDYSANDDADDSTDEGLVLEWIAHIDREVLSSIQVAEETSE